MIRIRCDATETQCPLGIKYGCDPQTEAPGLLSLARDLGLSIVGVSFHVGSGCNEPAAFRRAISASAAIFQLAQQLGFMNMYLLNIGGGFPGNKNTSLDKVCTLLNNCLLNSHYNFICTFFRLQILSTKHLTNGSLQTMV